MKTNANSRSKDLYRTLIHDFARRLGITDPVAAAVLKNVDYDVPRAEAAVAKMKG